MIGFAIFFIQIFLVQNAFGQAVKAKSNINNGIPPSIGPMIPGLGSASLAAANMNAGFAGQMVANGANAAFNQIGAQPHGIASSQIGIAPGQMGITPGQMGIAPGQIGIPNGQMGLSPNQMGLAAAQMGVANNQRGLTSNQMSLAAAQMGVNAGQMGIAPGQMGLTPGQMGVPNALPANQLVTGYGPNFGGSGSGDVAVAGELPVVGNTAITGQVPLSGKVAFTGTLPAGGVVTISGQCGGAVNNGPLNTPYGTKLGYNNKSYLH